ncbi:bpX6 domain-containing protein [Ralstonia pseudosolanacearum]|uniref:MoxR-vWA-beta-propeller ternary system domain-containing protein n=1 Tax=Ralstonia solanacearum TaxID=305 RepID=A0A0S4TMD7_RALSL|nr:conserved protein of unknown function [Ralstonia solanacearum]
MPQGKAGVVSCAVRQPSLCGHLDLAGVWFPADWFDLSARRHRILADWRPGSRVFSFPQGDLLCFGRAQELDCATLAGWPLVMCGRTLSSARLSPAEAASLPPADAWIVSGAQVLPLDLGDAAEQDPGTWLATADYALLETYDCRAALPESEVEIARAGADVRAVLGVKAPPADAQRESLLSLLRAPASVEPEPSHRVPPAQASQPVAGRGLRRWPLAIGAATVGALVWYGLGGADALQGWGGTGLLDLGALLTALALVALMMVLGWNPSRGAGPGRHPAAPGTAKSDVARSAQAGPTVRTGSPEEGRFISQWHHWLARAAMFARGARPSGHRQAPEVAGAGKSRQAAPPVGTLLPRGGWRAPQQWRHWLARAAMFTQVSRLLGRRNAAYLRHMVALFEAGQLDEALRHAIPLGGEQGSLGESFAALRARQDLSMRQRLMPGPSVRLGDGVDDYLRQLYRNSFEKLDRAGRVDEAAFVLAELLESRQEALDYLEKHERYQQAAELALAWDRPAAVIVRLHCLAGDWRVAVAVARRDRAFADAVLMLEKRWPDPARRLRLEWAQALAAQGDWLGAVEVAWQVPEARDEAALWLEHAHAAGGELAARGLVQRAQLLPETLPQYAVHLQTLRDARDRHAERAALAQALLGVRKRGPALASLARLVTGAILADQAHGVGTLNRKALQNLVHQTGDRLLQADLPNGPLPVPDRPALRARTPALLLDAPAAGVRSICDAVTLHGGRYLLALGEAGAAVVDGRGALVSRFAVPAERLVIADSRQVALALARRGDLWRVSRIELPTRRVIDLGMLPVGQCAMQFDGIAWTVAHGSRVRVFDASRAPCSVLWQVDTLPGEVRALSRTQHTEQWLIASGAVGATSAADWQLWRYTLPARRLISRDEVPALRDGETLLLDAVNGPMRLSPLTSENDSPSLSYACAVGRHAFGFQEDAGARPIGVRAGAGWLRLLMLSDQGGRTFRIQTLGSVADRVRLRWPAAEAVHDRFDESAWLAFDSAGRLVHVDLADGEVRMLSIQ